MTTIKARGGLAASWTQRNILLASRELGVETDTGRVKVGDGIRHWDDLPYVGALRVSTVTTLPTLIPSAIIDQFNITAQESALAIANPTAADLTDGQSLLIRIKDNGTAKAITWDTYYRAIGVTLPTTTVAGKVLYLGAKWNAAETKFDVISVGRQT